MSTEKLDIVERLSDWDEDWRPPSLAHEAAIEIVRLRVALAHERAVNEAALRTCAEAEGEAIALREALAIQDKMLVARLEKDL